MQRPIKYTLIGLVIIAIAGITPFAATPILRKVGDNSIRQLARDGNFCKTDGCDEGYDYVISFLETNYQLSPDDVRYCMGVDVISHQEWWIGNNIKNSLTDSMYKRCGEPAQIEQKNETPAE